MGFIAKRPIRLSGRVFQAGEAVDASLMDEVTLDEYIRYGDISQEAKPVEEPAQAEVTGDIADKTADTRKKKSRK